MRASTTIVTTLVIALAVTGVLAPPTAAYADPIFTPLVDDHLALLITPSPDGLQPWVRAIDAATTSIDLAMFHLTDVEVADALIRAQARGLAVRVIVDATGLRVKKNAGVFKALKRGNVVARESSTAFSITHEKAMVVDRDTDHATAFITSINLTRDSARTRDLGIVTHAGTVVADVETLFAADWTNAEKHGHVTPALHDASLVVSPTNSRAKLVALIASAQHTLVGTVENLGDPELAAAFAAAVRRGVAVRMIVPACDKNSNPLYNLPTARALVGAGVDVRLMPAPETADTPYMHSKMLLVDGATAYVGSVNFSLNSTKHARELGVIVANAPVIAQIQATFDADWAHVIAITAADPICRGN
jgi:phosphatidylserine/phosphatidylglycerophosphate/cardiolipin synthase-like enzyme